MPTWVTPVVAAEIWNTSIDRVMSLIQAGEVVPQIQGPFVLVDVHQKPAALQDDVPQTWRSLDAPTNALTRDEIIALRGTLSDDLLIDPAETPIVTDLEPSSGIQPFTDFQNSTESFSSAPDISEWRQVRQRVSRTRTPPRTPRIAA